MSTTAPLIEGDDLEAPFAWRDGLAISRRQYLADVQALAARLPDAGPMFNVTGDRYRFAVGLGAAMLRGQSNLMPPNHTADTVARMRELFPLAYGLTDHPAGDTADDVRLPMTRHAAQPAPLAPIAEACAQTAVPHVDRDLLAAQVLTSGSTGAPVPHAKRWGLLVDNTRAGASRLAEQMGRAERNRAETGRAEGDGAERVRAERTGAKLGRADLRGVSIVATVPAQHMYGFESTVLIAMLGGAAFDAGRPFYPADIAAALERVPRPRMLVTTPFHLRTLLDAGMPLPALDLVVCATAPLAPQLAMRAEAAFAAPLMEIYGCTEAGQVATRRSTEGAEWRVYDGLRLSGDGAETVVRGGHVPQPVVLADVIEVVSPTRFRLLGRSNDLINIAGKRSSLGHLNFHLNSIAGIEDGAFWLPPDASGSGTVRPVAFVVAPTLAAHALHGAVVAALRHRVDAAFLPRRVVAVPALPREAATAKLPAGAFAAWAARTLDARRG